MQKKSITPKLSPPLVSIVIINYNYAPYITDAINSALEQSYANVEILVIDDGSTDSSIEIIKSFLSSGIKYYIKQNGGPSSARNYGALKASGEYIIFLDADDILNKSYIRSTLSAMQQYIDMNEVGFIYTQLRHFGAISKITEYPEYDGRRLIVSNFIAVTCLIKRSIILKHPFDESLRSWEDWDLYLTLAEHGIVGKLLDKPLLNYRRHPETSSNLDTQNIYDKALLKRRLVNKHRGLYSKRYLIEHDLRYIATRIRHAHSWKVNY